MTTQKVLLVLQGIEPYQVINTTNYITAISREATAGDFQILFDTLVVDPSYSYKKVIGSVTSDVDITKPTREYAFVDAGSIVANLQNRDCAIAMLVYDDALYPGTISVETPQAKYGVICCALPISKLGSNDEGLEQNICHELLHAEYFAVNQEGANLPDDVHSRSNPFDKGPMGYPAAIAKLAPYLKTPPKFLFLRSLQLQAVVLLTKLRDVLQAKLDAKKNLP